MPKPTTDILDDMNERLRRAGLSYMTLPWSDFSKLCGRKRLKQPFLDRVRKEAPDSDHRLIVAYGRNVVVVCYDRIIRVTLPDEF